jgi:hypothetical protein
MAMRRKTARPVDRAVDELDRQIAELQKQVRQLEHEPANHGGAESRPNQPAVTEKVTGFVRSIIAPAKKPVGPSPRARADLFDAGNEPLKDLEAEEITFTRKPAPDLFSQATEAGDETGGVAAATAAPEATEKLTRYLSAGSIKTYKPLKRAQRQTRNRFFMWLGLSFVAFWVIYIVVR